MGPKIIECEWLFLKSLSNSLTDLLNSTYCLRRRVCLNSKRYCLIHFPAPIKPYYKDESILRVRFLSLSLPLPLSLPLSLYIYVYIYIYIYIYAYTGFTLLLSGPADELAPNVLDHQQTTCWLQHWKVFFYVSLAINDSVSPVWNRCRN